MIPDEPARSCACVSDDARRCWEIRYLALMDDVERHSGRFDDEECECYCHHEQDDDL